MRVCSRIALVVIFLCGLLAPAAFAQKIADCPLDFVASNPGATAFYQSPHGIFRSGSQVFALRGQTLSTYNVTDVGDLQVVREDFIGSLGAREYNGGIAFSNGFLFLSSEAGLEIYDLRNVRSGGTAPLLVSRTPNLHYRRLAVSGNTLAALFPATDLPCSVNGTTFCSNAIDIYNITNLSAPVRAGSISSANSFFVGFNDIAFNAGFLTATGVAGTYVFNVANRANPMTVSSDVHPGTFLVSNGGNLLATGNDTTIVTYSLNTATGNIDPITLNNINSLRLERSNPIMFHPQGTFDETNGRIILMVDEMDPQTLKPARTFAFDVFDYTVPFYDGFDPKINEYVSYTIGDEVKWNPVAVGPFIYVVGETTGLQTYGACGQVAGRIEFDTLLSLNCGGSEIHGWVTGAQRISNVELFLDGASLGTANLAGPPRTDIPSKTVVTPWRISVNLDSTAKGEHVLRAIGTDATGNRRQFASQRVFFNGPGLNCSNRRRTAAIH